MELDLLTLPGRMSSPPVVSGVRVTRSLVLGLSFVDRFLSFVLFLLVIVLSVLRFTASDYPFGIFKFFLGKRSVPVLSLWKKRYLSKCVYTHVLIFVFINMQYFCQLFK